MQKNMQKKFLEKSNFEYLSMDFFKKWLKMNPKHPLNPLNAFFCLLSWIGNQNTNISSKDFIETKMKHWFDEIKQDIARNDCLSKKDHPENTVEKKPSGEYQRILEESENWWILG